MRPSIHLLLNPEPCPLPPSILIIGIGNPSRGDDALGPMLIEQMEELRLPDIELLTDFQLQVEYALDLRDRREVIFVDASLNAAPPFSFTPVFAADDSSYSSHALSPGAVLLAYQKLFGEPPPAFVLAIRGEAFELGASLSASASAHLAAATTWLRQRICPQHSPQSGNQVREFHLPKEA